MHKRAPIEVEISQKRSNNMLMIDEPMMFEYTGLFKNTERGTLKLN